MMSEEEERGMVHASTDSHTVPLNDVKIDASDTLYSSRPGDIKVYINVGRSEVLQQQRRAVKDELEIDWSSFHLEYIFNKRGALCFVQGVCSVLIIILAGSMSSKYNAPGLIIVFASVSLAFCLVSIIFNVFFLDFVTHMGAKILEVLANLLLVVFHLTNFILGVTSQFGADLSVLSIILTMLFLVSTFFSLQDLGCCKEVSAGEPSKAKRKRLAVKRKKKIRYSRLGKR